MFYIIIFLTDATIPHTILENVRTAAFDVTKLDSCYNALFRPPGPAAAGRVGLYILLLGFIFLFFC